MKQTKKIKKETKEPTAAGKLTPGVTTRFTQVMHELIGLNKRNGGAAKSVKDFAVSIHTNASNFSSYNDADNGRNVTLEMCCELCRVHAVNANWLLLGTGEKFYNSELSTRLNKMEQRLMEVEERIGGLGRK